MSGVGICPRRSPPIRPQIGDRSLAPYAFQYKTMVCFAHCDGKRYNTNVCFVYCYGKRYKANAFLFMSIANVIQPMCCVYCVGKRYNPNVFCLLR